MAWSDVLYVEGDEWPPFQWLDEVDWTGWRFKVQIGVSGYPAIVTKWSNEPKVAFSDGDLADLEVGHWYSYQACAHGPDGRVRCRSGPFQIVEPVR